MQPSCTKTVSSRYHRLDYGFTLLELVIVLMLIGLLMVVTVPTLRSALIDDPLRSSARKLIGYVGVVRDKAVLEQQSYLVYIDLDQNRLWHVAESDDLSGIDDPPEKGLLQLVAGVDLRDVWMKTTDTMTSGRVLLWVSRQGYMDHTIFHLEDGDGESLSLVVPSFLPNIDVHEGYYEPE